MEIWECWNSRNSGQEQIQPRTGGTTEPPTKIMIGNRWGHTGVFAWQLPTQQFLVGDGDPILWKVFPPDCPYIQLYLADLECPLVKSLQHTILHTFRLARCEFTVEDSARLGRDLTALRSDSPQLTPLRDAVANPSAQALSQAHDMILEACRQSRYRQLW